MPTQQSFEVVKLLQELLNSLKGNTNFYDPNYVKDVKSRIPEIERNFQNLKQYFEE
ncbi:hypothetical protein LC040_01895 [Bacillus tianshenii]|nr:hypothetical protein LC040_01895 [Bacillus tianshenii]